MRGASVDRSLSDSEKILHEAKYKFIDWARVGCLVGNAFYMKFVSKDKMDAS